MGLLDEAIREHLALKRGRGADPAEIAREEQEALGPPTRAEAPAAEEHGDSADATPDEPVAELTPGEGAPRAGREPSEPRLRLAAEPPERDEPGPAPEGRGGPATGEPPAPAEPRGPRVSEEDLREPLHARGEPPPPPLDDDVPPELADDEPHTDDFVFGDEDEGEDDDFFADEPEEPRAGERPPEAGGPLDQPTQQYALEDVEDATRPAQPPAPPAGEEDVPEGEDLLEETPEFLEETPEHDRLWFEQKPPRDFDF